MTSRQPFYGNVEEDVYMYPPEGYNYKGKAFKLKKALYGLKQASLRWNICFTDFLNEKKSLESEQCIFKKKDKELILGIYVDDGILIGKDFQEIEETIKQLKTEFKMTALYKPKTFVGLEIRTEEDKIKLKLEDYTNKVLKQYGMEDARCKMEDENTDFKKRRKKCIKKRRFSYREAIGSLLYLSTKTRPDISYGVGYCNRYIKNYSQEDVNDVKHIMKYLNRTKEQGIQ